MNECAGCGGSLSDVGNPGVQTELICTNYSCVFSPLYSWPVRSFKINMEILVEAEDPEDALRQGLSQVSKPGTVYSISVLDMNYRAVFRYNTFTNNLEFVRYE